MFILATDQIKKWWWGIKNTPSFKLLLFKIVTSSDQLKKIGTKTAFIAIILIWYLIETIVIAPHFIAYFNEFVGGAKNGYKYAVDSNLDWGQDLKRLAKFVEENHIEKLKLIILVVALQHIILAINLNHGNQPKKNPNQVHG